MMKPLTDKNNFGRISINRRCCMVAAALCAAAFAAAGCAGRAESIKPSQFEVEIVESDSVRTVDEQQAAELSLAADYNYAMRLHESGRSDEAIKLLKLIADECKAKAVVLAPEMAANVQRSLEGRPPIASQAPSQIDKTSE